MARYQLLIEYVGTDFRGWQIQKKGSTIQGLIQEKLTKLLKEKIILNGSGRTDTGVHAIEQSGHFDSKNEIKNLTKFLKSINHFLNDKGVAIKKIRKRSNKFHSRFSAKQRVYKYIIFNNYLNYDEITLKLVFDYINTIKKIKFVDISYRNNNTQLFINNHLNNIIRYQHPN